MLSKNEIKYIQSLGLKKNRDSSGLFVAEGPKIVSELATAFPQQIERLFALPGWIETNTVAAVETTAVTETELERISQLQTPNTVLALVRQFPLIEPATYNFALYLDAIQDPGNFGTIIRTADWFGVDAIVCSNGCADIYSPKVVQSTMASIGRVAVYYDREEQWLQRQTKPKYAATLYGRSLTDVEPLEAGILMIGNESKGLRPVWTEMADTQITIPRKGSAESLNAAVATGIILAQLRR